MFLLMVLAAVLVATALLGGDLTRLGRLRVRAVWLPIVAILVQVVIIEIVDGILPAWADETLHVATYAAIVPFLLLNRRVPGLLLLGLGVVSNGVTIAVNGGRLPVDAGAARAAGLVHRAGDFSNTGVLAHPRLAWLGDVIPTPSFLPLRNVMSVGDLLILLGATWLVWSVCGNRWTRPWAERPAPADADVPADAVLA